MRDAHCINKKKAACFLIKYSAAQKTKQNKTKQNKRKEKRKEHFQNFNTAACVQIIKRDPSGVSEIPAAFRCNKSVLNFNLFTLINIVLSLSAWSR